MASFEAKIGWIRLRKKKINIIVLFRSYPTRYRKFQKNSKKIQKIKKSNFGLTLSHNSWGKNEKERK